MNICLRKIYILYVTNIFCKKIYFSNEIDIFYIFIYSFLCKKKSLIFPYKNIFLQLMYKYFF